MELRIEISPGEFYDRMTILQIKTERIKDPDKLTNVRAELAYFEQVAQSIASDAALVTLVANLKRVNEMLWEIEDDIRECERDLRFDQAFIDLARAVYHTNDRRAVLKREINLKLASTIVEEKSYQPY